MMNAIRGLLIGILNIVVVLILVFGTLGGFVAGGNANPFHFNIGLALIGAIVGFIVGAVAAGSLALMLDIREILLRIEGRGLR
jgi:hypothetical protein